MDLQKVTEDHSKKPQSGGTTVMAKEETPTCVEIVVAWYQAMKVPHLTEFSLDNSDSKKIETQ